MPKIKVNDIEMYYEIHGKGEPLVLIAGFSIDHLGWGAVLDKFAEKYQVLIFDSRGAGRSDVPSGHYSIEQMTADVVELCKKLDINKAHFLGNSMGGFIVQMLAHRHPELVKTAIISNSTMKTQNSIQLYIAAQCELMRVNVPINWAFPFQFITQMGKLYHSILWSMTNPHPFTLTGFQGQFAALESFDSTEWAHEIKTRTLVMAGDQDLVFSAPVSIAMAETIPGASYYCFRACGHLPQLECPENFIAVVDGFLSSV